MAIEFEQSQKPSVLAKESRKIEFELIKLNLRVFFQQRLIGPRRWVLDQLNDADDFAVVERYARYIGLIANQAVFRAVLQAVDMPSDAAFEVTLNFCNWQVEQLSVLDGVLEELGDGLGSETIGIETVGQHATERTSPMPAADMACGVKDGLVEEELPIGPELTALHTVHEQEKA